MSLGNRYHRIELTRNGNGSRAAIDKTLESSSESEVFQVKALEMASPRRCYWAIRTDRYNKSPLLSELRDGHLRHSKFVGLREDKRRQAA